MSNTRQHPIESFEDCPCAGRNLDKFIQALVLAGLSDGPLHGYRILQNLASLPMFEGHRPDATGIYRFLKAMEERGLVTSAWDLAESGPAKRMFDLTAAGRVCMAKWVATIDTYHRQVGQLLEYLRKQVSGARACGCGCSKTKPGRPPVRKRKKS